jgi:hypothetical protein
MAMKGVPTSNVDRVTAQAQRVQSVMDLGFTERQARFLVLVMRHAGVCVPRQYAAYAAIANGGRRCNAFFDRLVRRGCAREIRCTHNRAHLYHVHHKPLYFVIGEVSSRYRRAVSTRLAIERLMLLDAVLAKPDVDWLTTTAEKATYLERLRGDGSDGRPYAPAGDQAPATALQPSSLCSIGIESDGRLLLLFLAGEPITDGFRTFLYTHAALCASLRCGRCASSFRARLIASTTPIKPSSTRNSSRRCTLRRSAS